MNKIIKIFLTCFCLCFLMLSCCACDEEKYQHKEIIAFDTVVSINAYGNDILLNDIPLEDYLYSLDRLLSVNSEESDIFRLNRDKAAKIGEGTFEIIEKAQNVSEMTNGAFDITVYPAVKAWGFTEEENRIPSNDELKSIIKLIDNNNVILDKTTNKCTLQNNASIDLGGCAKGYIGDKTADFLKENGIKNAVISLGGNIRTVGEKPNGNPYKVGIIYPDTNDYFAVLSLFETNVISSGAYQRNFKGANGIVYHHIIDPKTASPAKTDILQSTVISNDGTLADCLSTALFVMGKDKAIEFCRNHSGFEAVILCNDSTVYITQGIEHVFELEQQYESINLNIIK